MSKTTMQVASFLISFLLCADAVYGGDAGCVGVCDFKPLCSPFPCSDETPSAVEIEKKSLVPRSLQALIGRIQDQRPITSGHFSGTRLRRLPSEFLGKRSEGVSFHDWNPSEMKRASELLGKRSELDDSNQIIKGTPGYGFMNGPNGWYLVRMRRARPKYKVTEFLGKRSDSRESKPEHQREPIITEETADE